MVGQRDRVLDESRRAQYTETSGADEHAWMENDCGEEMKSNRSLLSSGLRMGLCRVFHKAVFFISLLLMNADLLAQEDFGWWVEKHHWDGITPWHQYMTMSSSFLGPNALPVPEIMNGQVDTAASLSVSFDHYSSQGDRTDDVFLKGVLPLFGNRMSVTMEVVPLEWYKMDTTTRDIRAVRTRSGEGSAGGDIYLSTYFQLLREKYHLPDIGLRISLRTASGTHLRDARFTDAPGYFFDLSLGKSYRSGSSFIREIRWYLDAGLYTYQTYDLQNLQDDCLFYGGGLTLNTKGISWSHHLAGYYGYLKTGDRPLVYRSELRLLRKIIDWSISYQWGINDYAYQRFRVSCIFHLPAEKIF
jgi:hypothetical protein